MSDNILIFTLQQARTIIGPLFFNVQKTGVDQTNDATIPYITLLRMLPIITIVIGHKKIIYHSGEVICWHIGKLQTMIIKIFLFLLKSIGIYYIGPDSINHLA